MSSSVKKIFMLGLSLGALNVGAAFAVDEPEKTPVAGEVLKKETVKPFTKVEPLNLTDLAPQKSDNEPNIYFNADELINDDKNKVIQAIGDVVVKREGLTLYADKLIYRQSADSIEAVGNVRLEEQNGNVVYADNVELSNKMTRAEMNKIKAVLQDESKLWAEHFHKKENNNKVMRKAVYTPCDFCEGTENPLWQIKARKVTHDAEAKDINYNDALLEFKGVPVFYTPFFSHPDPTVKRRSGFLVPNIGSSNYLGGTLQVNYFWNINSSTDILFTPIFTTYKDVVWGGQYRQYFNKGYVDMSGSYLRDNNDARPENRGNLFAYGRYEINDYWVADANLNYTSDTLYLKELDLEHDDDAWLMSNVRLQYFDNRDYAAIEAYYYKLISYDLRRSNNYEYERRKYNRPFVAPVADYENISDVNSLGAYWKNNFSMASVYHEEDAQTQRMSMINAWVLPWTSSFGERYRIQASLKSDLYYVDKYQAANQDNDFSGEVIRTFPQVGVEWRLPFVKATENTRQILEPIVVGVLAPNGGNMPEKIPNEDSEDVELDDTNILSLDRYSGYDRNDTGSRVSYGFNWSSYGNIMGRTSAFIAQSYQFSNHSSFTGNIDNEGHFTDYVGRIYAAPSQYLDLDYRFRLGKDDLKIQYSELGARVGSSMLSLYASYIFLQENQNSSEYFKERKELYTSIKAALTRDWSVSVYNRQDLADSRRGSLEHGGNLIYEDECFMFITTVKRSNSNNPELDDGYEFNFTFYLKTLGGLGA